MGCVIDNTYIRANLRQVFDVNEIFGHENVFLLNENGVLIGLNLSNSGLSDLTDISSFRPLRFLDVSDNSVSDTLPLRYLVNLEKIDLAFNNIDDLSFVHHLPRLVFLDVRSNQIKRLPSSFANLTLPIRWHYVFQNHGLFLEDNPLDSPPVEVITAGDTAVREYLQSVDGGSEPLNEFKLVLLGGGRAGKTSVVRRFCGESFRVDEEVTRGVNLRTVISPSGRVRAHVWDFGGQESMYATHACFLTTRCVFWVVLDGRREEKAEYWLKLIETIGGDSPVYIVINKIDENPRYDLNRGDLHRHWPNIEDIVTISCSTGEGVQSFLDRFWKRAPDFPLAQIDFSPEWFRAKDALMAYPKALVQDADCNAILAENGVSDPDQISALLSCLHDLGIIVHFTGFSLEGSIVLQPSWLTTGLYAFLEDSSVQDKGGILVWSQVDRVLLSLRGTGDYSADARRFIVNVMIAFEVCFAIDRDHLLIPDLLRRDEPEGLPIFASAKSEVLFSFDFLPLSVLHKAISRLHEDLDLELLWRTGAVLKPGGMEATALVRADEVISRIHLTVEGTARREYLTVVRHSIRNAIRASGKIAWTESLRLPTAESYFVPIEEIKGLQRMGVTVYPHGLSGQLFDIAPLLSEVESVANGNRAPDRAVMDTHPVPQRFVFMAYARKDRPFVDQLAQKLRAIDIPVWYDVNIEGGRSFPKEIESRILNCSAMILIVTPEAHESSFIRDEIALANEHNKPIIPIQLRLVNRWIEIASTQWLHADDGKFLSQLFRALSPHL
jgi:hypothetical protein